MNVPRTVLLAVCLLSTEGLKSQIAGAADSVDDYVRSKMIQFRIPGLALMVVQEGRPRKLANYGLASLEFGVPVSDSTVFQIASVTKLFTSTVVMKLVEQHRLGLDQPLTAFLDSVPESWKDITVRHLLNHTSGIRDHFQTERWRSLQKDGHRELTLRDVLAASASEPLEFEPGARFSYSVTGYVLLGLVVERVSGKPIDAVARGEIFEPLGMRQTAYGDYRAVIRNRNSYVYTYQQGPLECWNFTYGLSGTTAAGLNTTTSDLSRFFSALDAGRILSKESMDEMMTPTRMTDGSEKDYGLGWAIDHHDGSISYGHEGGGCCWIDYYRASHLTVAVLCNLTGSKADEIVKGVAGFFLK